MDDKSKQNKGYVPAENKQVKIKFRPGRAMEGVIVDANGYATVDAKTADYLVKINYAVMAEENNDVK